MKKIYILPIVMLFVIGLSSCFGEPRHKIEGLTDEIYRECSGIWTLEKYYKDVKTIGMLTSSGRATGGQRGFSLIIDLRSETGINIWPPDMGSFVVKSVEKIDEKTIELSVVKFRASIKTENKEYKPLDKFLITLHFFDKNRMWIDSRVSEEKGGGSLIIYDGTEYIYKKVSGPDMEPSNTNKLDK